MNYGRAKPASGHTDSPKHRKLIHSFDSDDDHAFDELQPMSLDFQCTLLGFRFVIYVFGIQELVNVITILVLVL